MIKKKIYKEEVKKSDLYKEFKREQLKDELGNEFADGSTEKNDTENLEAIENTLDNITVDSSVADSKVVDNSVGGDVGSVGDSKVDNNTDDSTTHSTDEDMNDNNMAHSTTNIIDDSTANIINDSTANIINDSTTNNIDDNTNYVVDMENLILKLNPLPPWFHNFILKIPFIENDLNGTDELSSETKDKPSSEIKEDELSLQMRESEPSSETKDKLSSETNDKPSSETNDKLSSEIKDEAAYISFYSSENENTNNVSLNEAILSSSLSLDERALDETILLDDFNKTDLNIILEDFDPVENTSSSSPVAENSPSSPVENTSSSSPAVEHSPSSPAAENSPSSPVENTSPSSPMENSSPTSPVENSSPTSLTVENDVPPTANMDYDESLSLSFPSEDESSSSSSKVEVSEFTIENSDSLEFPEVPPIETVDWNYLEPLLFHLLDSPSSDKNISDEKNIGDDKNISKNVSKNVRDDKNVKSDQSIFFDQRYLYFLKKVCNLTRKECVMYGREHNKLLTERGAKNKARVPPYKKTEGRIVSSNFTGQVKKRYVMDIEDSTSYIEIKMTNSSTTGRSGGGSSFSGAGRSSTGRSSPGSSSAATGGSSSVETGVVRLKQVKNIKDLTVPKYDKDAFEYIVYKHNDNLKTIALESKMDLRDVILLYYLKYHNRTIEMTGSLLDRYVDAEWSLRDRIIFEENFNKYGTKFNKFIINKNEQELRIYYRYYLKNYLPVNWTEAERTLFAHLSQVYKSDWNSMAEHFEKKNANDLRVFYSSYFKKLDEEEKSKELGLVEIEVPKVEVKRRGRKPYKNK